MGGVLQDSIQLPGYYRLVEHLQQPIAHFEGPELPQEEQPVQFVVYVYTQVLVVVHLLPSDGDMGWGPLH